MQSWVLVAVQAALAAVAIAGLWRRVLPVTARMRHAALLLDVWGPVAIVLPMLFAAGRVDGPIIGPGWIAVGGPVVAATLAMGIALVLPAVESAPGSRWPRLRGGLACVGAGMLLLLLGAAHELTTAVGQVSFAAGAVLLWINTPLEERTQADTPLRPEQAAAALWTVIILACGIGQGLAYLWVEGPAVRVSAALLLGYGAAGLLASIRRGEPGGSRRLAAWTASLGVLLSLGVVSLAHLLPRVREALASGAHETAEMLRRLAFGFGHLAPEAVLLILLGAFAAFGDDRRMPARRWIGGAILGATAWLIVHRMVLV